MNHQISIRAAQNGWTVEGDTFTHGMMFLSGKEAEAAARALAGRYAQSGRSTEVRVFLRDGTLAGRFLCAADEATV